MTFPFDIRWDTYVAKKQVPSAMLNAVQDASLTNYRGATAVVGAAGLTVDRGDWICDGANDQVEIQAAINWVAAQGGGTVMLTTGTFDIRAMIDIPEKVLLVGAGAGTILLINSAVATDFNVIEIDGVSNASCWNFSIDGNITGGHGHFHTGVSVLGAAAGTVIERLYLRNFAMSGGSAYGYGVDITGTADRTRVFNITTYNCRQNGIKAGSTASEQIALISNCVVRGGGAGGGGIYIAGGSNVQAILNEVYSCATGIQVSYSADAAPPTDIILATNHISGSTASGIYARGSALNISGNSIVASGAHGIWAEDADISNIGGNMVRTCDNHGIWVDSCDDSLFERNVIVDVSQDVTNVDSGIYIDGGNRCTVTGNKFRFNAVKKGKASIEGAAGGSGSASVYGNDCRAGATTAEIIDGGGDMVTTPYYTWDGAAHNLDDVQKANRVS